MESRKRQLVLVTGAGASLHLGRDDRQLPLMADWSNTLIEALGRAEPGLASTIDLREGLGGEEFEERLGAFLRWTQTFDAIGRFLPVGRPGPDTPITSEVKSWLSRAQQRATLIVQAINASLWREFGLNRIDRAKAGSTYQELFRALDVLPGEGSTQLVSATTNYDLSGEAALDRLGYIPDTGARAEFGGTHHLDLEQVDPWGDDPSKVPHLHLHGAVGWYRQPGKGIRIEPGDQDYDDRLSPAVLYPDPDKDPLGEVEMGVHALWGKLADAMQSATHVLVVGHSLHDRPLLDALGECAQRGQARFAFCHHGDSEPIAVKLRSHRSFVAPSHDLSLIPIDFQPGYDFSKIHSWIDGATIRQDGSVHR